MVPKLVFQLQMSTDTMLRALNDNKTAVQATINGLKADDCLKVGVLSPLGQWRRDESLITTLFKRKYENIKPLQASVSLHWQMMLLPSYVSVGLATANIQIANGMLDQRL